MHDVAIVGSGPSGLRLARLLRGLDVVILEKNRRIGKKTCSGLVSANIKRFAGLGRPCIEHAVSGADMHFPFGDIRLRKNGLAAYVIDREVFDRSLAKDMGNLKLGIEVRGFEVREDRVRVETSGGPLECRILVGCDGACSTVRRRLGERPEKMVNGLVAHVNRKDYSDRAEIWFDRKRVPDGFFWKIPRGKKTEYGAWGSRVTFRDLKGFFGLKKCRMGAAPIPLGLIRTSFERVILLGDAACQVKPWSGGGIVWSFAAAEIAARKIRKALESGDMGVLEEYDREWKAELAPLIRKGMRMRKFYRYAPGTVMRLLLMFFSRKGRLDRLDMDFL